MRGISSTNEKQNAYQVMRSCNDRTGKNVVKQVSQYHHLNGVLDATDERSGEGSQVVVEPIDCLAVPVFDGDSVLSTTGTRYLNG